MFPFCLLCSVLGSTNIIRFLNFCNFFLSIALQYFYSLCNFAWVILIKLHALLNSYISLECFQRVQLFQMAWLKFGQHFQQGCLPCLQQIRFSDRENLLTALPKFSYKNFQEAFRFLSYNDGRLADVLF